MTLRMLAFGALFGFILARVGATDYAIVSDMFAAKNWHLAGVIGVAIALTAPMLYMLRKRGIAGPSGCRVAIAPKPRQFGNIPGSLLFGTGWAITGTCPGTALAQLGEGRWMALFTIAGIMAGTWLHVLVKRRAETRAPRSSQRAPVEVAHTGVDLAAAAVSRQAS